MRMASWLVVMWSWFSIEGVDCMFQVKGEVGGVVGDDVATFWVKVNMACESSFGIVFILFDIGIGFCF